MTIYREALSMNAKFHDAIKRNDLDKVKDMVEANPDININSEIGLATPILYAAQNEYWDMVLYFFQIEANLDVKMEPHNWYLVHECIVNAPLKVTKSVLNYCNINVQTLDGETPLMIAIKNNKEDIANFIIDTDRANLLLGDKDKNNALHYAAKYNKQDLFVKIVNKSRGNILSETNKQGLFPEELLEDELFKNNLSNLLDNNKMSNLHTQIRINHIENAIEEVPEVDINMDFLIEENIEEVKPKKVTGLSTIKKKK